MLEEAEPINEAAASQLSIPAFYQEKQDDGKFKTLYCIVLNDKKLVARRYSEFQELHQILLNNYPSSRLKDFVFPAKSYFFGSSSSESAIEERRISFEAYINEIILMDPLPFEVRLFLQLPKNDANDENLLVSNDKAEQDDYEHDDENLAVHENKTDNEPSRPTLLNPLGFVPNPLSIFGGSSNSSNTHSSENAGGTSASSSFLPVSIPMPIHMPFDMFGSSSSSSSGTNGGEQKSSEEDLKAAERTIEDPITFFNRVVVYCIGHISMFATVYILVNAFIVAYFIRDYKLSVGLVLSMLRNRLRVFLHGWRFGSEVVIVCVIVVCTYHALVGHLLTLYLRRLLATPGGGYNFRFGSVSLRLGFRIWEVVVSDFYWLNAPRFTDTPFFCKVTRLVLIFDPWVVIDALRHSKTIEVVSLEGSGLEVYMEREVRDDDENAALNLWAALGADTPKQEKDLSQGMVARVQQAMSSTANFAAQGAAAASNAALGGAKAAANLAANTTTAAANAAVGGAKAVAHAAATYNPLSVLYRMTTSANSEEAAAGGAEGSVDGKQQSHAADGEEQGSSGDGHGETEGQQTVAVKEEEQKGNQKKSVDPYATAAAEPPPPKKRDPIILELNLFAVRDIVVFAQDYINPYHTKPNETSPIEIPIMEMKRRDLTKANPSGRGYRVGLTFGELLFAVIARLVNEIIAYNKVALSMNLASALTSNVGAGVLGGGKAMFGAASGTGKAVFGAASGTGQAVFGAASGTGKAVFGAASGTAHFATSSVLGGGQAVFNVASSATGSVLGAVGLGSSSSSLQEQQEQHPSVGDGVGNQDSGSDSVGVDTGSA